MAAFLNQFLIEHARDHGWSLTTTKRTRRGLAIALGLQDTPGAPLLATDLVNLQSIGITSLRLQEVCAAAGLLDDDRESAVKGGAEDNQVTIHQTGGTLDGVAFLDEDNPLLEVGERGIFYLQKVPAGYVTLSGPTGRMTIAEGKALPLPASTLTDIGTFKDVSAVIAETERLSTE